MPLLPSPPPSSSTDCSPSVRPSVRLSPLLQLANYLILCRAFHFVPYFAPMHPGRMFITFASLAAVAELLAIAGVAYLSNHALPDKSMEVGVTLAKTSLATQIIIVALLFPLAGTFHHCCRAGKIRSPKVMRPLLLLYANMVLLLGRTVYYMVEHFGFPPQNEDRDPMSLSPTVRHEWYFLVFDATFMLICSVLWNIWHPRHFLPEAREMYLAQDGVTVLKGPGWKDSRSLTETFFNPFAMLTTHGGHQKQFWEHNGFTLKTRRKKPAGRV